MRVALLFGAAAVWTINFLIPNKVISEINLVAQIILCTYLAIFVFYGVKEIYDTYKESIEYEKHARRIGFIKDPI